MPQATSASDAMPRYELRASQVATPLSTVELFWSVFHKHRSRAGRVLDMGAGDGRFARFGRYDAYTGIEIDPDRIPRRLPNKKARVIQGCVFARKRGGFDACIGNPPYLRHQDIEMPWKQETIDTLSAQLGFTLSGHANLFIYFMAQGLLRTTDDGLCALLVPFDWVHRPSGRGLRDWIEEKRWQVTVYRFVAPVFDAVETTATISVIDKSVRSGDWHYYNIDADGSISKRNQATGTGRLPLAYQRASVVFTRRGISPGTQPVFTLTDGERRHHGLHRSDVVRCVTSLRGLSDGLRTLSRAAFEKHFVRGGRRCWLIRCRGRLSDRLKAYLAAMPEEARSSATCKRQSPWYVYEKIGSPPLLVHSGFTGKGPRMLVNKAGAIPVGSMYGVFGCSSAQAGRVRQSILSESINSRVVPHSGRLKKVEVGQLNTILSKFR
jgi:hypothetical protein